MRLFLDANILFSAAISPQGRASALFALAQNGACSLLTSPYPIEETRRNVQARYPKALTRLEGELLPWVLVAQEASVERIEWAIFQGLPAKDAPILAAAVESEAELLVTGDKTHFGLFYNRVLEGVEVVDLRTALERVIA